MPLGDLNDPFEPPNLDRVLSEGSVWRIDGASADRRPNSRNTQKIGHGISDEKIAVGHTGELV